MRTTIDLPEPLLRQVKARAALHGTTLKDLMTHFVEQGLRRLPGDERSAVERARSPIPIARAGTGKPLPTLRNRDLYRILDLEDAERVAHD